MLALVASAVVDPQRVPSARVVGAQAALKSSQFEATLLVPAKDLARGKNLRAPRALPVANF